MKQIPTRIMIYPKDVMAICGMSQDSAWRLLKRIRQEYDKPRHAPVTIREFCEFTHVRMEEVEEFIKM